MIEFRLLGPLEVRSGGATVPLPAGKPRALLARLLLDAARVVPVDALVESVWGERPPPSAPKVVQVHVSQLRKLLGADRIETRPPGYRLVAARSETDLGRFETLTESARAAHEPRRRAELLREALSLWRGPALAEFRSEPFAVGAARRLDELRLAAIEQRVEAELELGEHDALVGELEALVAAEPLREHLRRFLMLALYRSGRQAEALECYRQGRTLLVEQFGIEPSAALQDLERAILRRDPRLGEARRDAVPRGPIVASGASLLPLLLPLCGEERELVLVEVARDASSLPEAAARLEAARVDAAVRTASFTSPRPAADLARLAVEQDAELLVLDLEPTPQAVTDLAAAPCDVAFAPRAELPFGAHGPVVVPFGGGREEWPTLELAAWLARAHRLPLRLLGAEARDGRRDASRVLASASLALQRFAGTATEPVLVAPGADAILAQEAALIVVALPRGELDAVRAALVERTTVPLLLVRPGLRPSGLAPRHTLTRFSWSLADER